MWKINCWLASLSVTDTLCNSAALGQQHVPACPALPSWHLPLVPLKPAFIVPRAGGRNKRMPELWAGWQGEARRGLHTPWPGQGSTLYVSSPGAPAPLWGQLWGFVPQQTLSHSPCGLLELLAPSAALWPVLALKP